MGGYTPGCAMAISPSPAAGMMSSLLWLNHRPNRSAFYLALSDQFILLPLRPETCEPLGHFAVTVTNDRNLHCLLNHFRRHCDV